jgi:hypothetical protein
MHRSASRVSQQSNLSSLLKDATPRFVGQAEHSPPQAGPINDENTPANQPRQSQLGPLSAMDVQHSHIDQHRLQAEYLSQVLYDDLLLAGQVLNALPISTTRFGKHRALEASKKGWHVHNITAPIGSTEIQYFPTSTATCFSRPPTLPPSHSIPFSAHVRVQSMVALRGGGGEPTPRSEHDQNEPSPRIPQFQSASVPQSPANENFPNSSSRDMDARFTREAQRPYMLKFPWARHFCRQPAWKVPISSGSYYEVFISKLPLDILHTFLPLFDPLHSATHWTSALANARRDFYHKLGHARQNLFEQMIMARYNELVAIERGGPDPQLHSRYPDTPRLMLYHLLEATEHPYDPTTSYFDSPADHMAYIVASRLDMRDLDGRSASVPNFGQQQGYAACLIIIGSLN